MTVLNRIVHMVPVLLVSYSLTPEFRQQIINLTITIFIYIEGADR